jgi:site-specific recombinase XerD
MIVEFTKAFLETGLVVPPGKQREEFCDTVQRGLVIQIAAMFKTVPCYVWRYKAIDTKKTTYRPLGSIKEISIPQARKQVAQWKAELSIAAKQAPKQKPVLGEMTLDTFWTEYYLPHAKLHKRSWQRDEQLYRLWLQKRYGASKLIDISRNSFMQYQAELAATHLSPSSQDHIIKLGRHLLGMAVQAELLERNVLRGIRLRNIDNQLHDVADPAGLQRYIEVLRTDSNRPVCNVLMYALSTGARLGEILKLTEDQLNLEQGLWTIPAANSKSKKSRTVPLNASALYVLAEAMKLKKTKYVFANPKTGLPFVTITRVRHRLQKLAGVKMRAHTLRHQFADSVLQNGGSLYSVQILLGHSDPRVSQRYAKLSMEAQRAAANGASVIVPRVSPPSAPEAKEEAEIPAETPTAAILPFPRAA